MPVPAAAAGLPVVEVLEALGVALASHRGAVVVAPPGAGKTTVVPLWLMDQPWLGGQRVVMLEPRRLATRAAAQRMATLLGEEVGATVGYQTRDERRIGRETWVEVLTEGVLTRRLQNDPELPGVGIVVFDEVHERNLPTDIGLALALDVRDSIRPDLRLLAMSATPDTPRLVALLGSDGSAAPIVQSDGRLHPVDVRSLPVMKGTRLESAAADAVVRALREEEGDVLVFLPGIAEIRRVGDRLRGMVPADVDVRQLAGALSLAEQDEALRPSPAGRRRVVLSTDIAESSLTVAGVRIVVDAGLARVPRFDPRTGMTRLATIATSRASADQRAGRAGRTEPGVAYRLWSKLEQSTRLAHLPPEITQVDLAGLALELAAWGTTAEALSFLDPPPPKALRTAEELLRMLSALDEDGGITPLGRSLLGLPVHPRLARMVAAADERDRGLACVVAAIVDERDILRGRTDELPADLAHRVRVVCGDELDERADRRGIDRTRDRALDIARRARAALRFDETDATGTGRVLALAYPDRVAVARTRSGSGQAGQFQLRTGGGAWVAKEDVLARERFVVAADLDGSRTNARIRLGAGLDAAELEHSLAADVDRSVVLVWDKQRGDLVQREEARLGSMLLDERVRPPEAGPATVDALVERVRITRLAALDMAAAEDLRSRVAFVGGLPGEAEQVERWPDWSDRALVGSLDEWLAPYLVRATGRADLERLDVAMALTSVLSWDQQTRLAELAPPTFAFAKGRPVRIDYSRQPPTVSLRVQLAFGTRRHPTVAGGTVPLAVELLSPADRPLQITRDLPGFWSGTWAQVRKEMAGRYPKHDWPERP